MDVAADHQCRRQVEAPAQAGGERPAQLGRDAVTQELAQEGQAQQPGIDCPPRAWAPQQPLAHQ